MTAGRLVLIGMMGSGKSTVAQRLAGRLGWEHVDSDDAIVRRSGQTVPELWQASGEEAFRAAETAVIADATAAAGPTVISLGGGAVLAAANRELIAAWGGPVIWLRARAETLVARVGDGAGRPLLEGDAPAALARIGRDRAAAYESVADVIVDVDGLEPDAVVDQIIVSLDAAARITGEESAWSR